MSTAVSQSNKRTNKQKQSSFVGDTSLNEQKHPTKAKEEAEREASAAVRVARLHFDATETALREFFSGCGEIVQVDIPLHNTGKHKGHAFVTFDSDQGGAAACKMHQIQMMGRQIEVSYAPAASYACATHKSNHHSVKTKEHCEQVLLPLEHVL